MLRKQLFVNRRKDQQDKRRLRHKIAQIERTLRQQDVVVEHTKNINFNGEGDYPMEFVKELEAIHREYYQDEDISWIGRHLDGEAAIWWKLICLSLIHI